MPYRPNTPCRHPGCAALVPYGQKYCEKPLVKGRVEILRSKILPDLDKDKASIMAVWQRHTCSLPLAAPTLGERIWRLYKPYKGL